MYILNMTNLITLLLLLVATILLIFLAQETKKSYISAIPLVFYLIMICVHGAQLLTLQEEFKNLAGTLVWCIAIDMIFIGISFFGYLWVDDIEAKEKGLKSVDNSLAWFWKNI